MRIEDLKLPVQQYEHPRTHPMMKSCKEFSTDKWAALKTAELITTACCHCISDEIDANRKPLYTVSSKSGVTTQYAMKHAVLEMLLQSRISFSTRLLTAYNWVELLSCKREITLLSYKKVHKIGKSEENLKIFQILTMMNMVLIW